MNIRIINAKIIKDDEIINGSLDIRDGKISAITASSQTETDSKVAADKVIDAESNYVSPGFVDIHSHGGGNSDFMDSTEEAFINSAVMHAKHGTTTLVPTLLSADTDEILSSIKAYNQVKGKKINGADMPGLHIEGPYFSPLQCGAQDKRYLRNPDIAEYGKILDATDDILRWSAAPELPGALEFGRHLRKLGILPSAAHTDATYEQMLEAFDAGYTHITHLYSAMSTVHRRNAFRFAGVVESAYLIDGMTVEIIADGVHLPASLLQFVTKFKSPDKVALVTDSMRGAGMPDGESILGSLKKGQTVIIEDGVAKLMDRTAFAGSVATTDRLVRNMVKLAGVSLTNAVRMMTRTPAEISGLKNIGRLEEDFDADVVIFDENPCFGQFTVHTAA